MAVHASLTGKKISPQVQLRRAGQRPAMALAAGRLDVLGRKNGLFPRQRTIVGFGNSCGSALAAMADRATELVQIVRDCRVRPIGLCGNIAQACLLQPNVATRAAIDHSEFRQPYLLNTAAKMAPQRIGVAAIANQFQIAALILAPFAKEIFCRGDCHRDQKNHTYDAERTYAVSKQPLPKRPKSFVHDATLSSFLRTLPRPNPRPPRSAEEGADGR